MEDTIAAIATPFGAGGLAVLRIAGPDAFHVANQIFVAADGTSVDRYTSHTIHFGRIVQNNNVVDQVLLSVMRAPRSYTKEDTVEISCHGGTLVASTILKLCLKAGARLAEPGEFTKRAFLNGRIDLTQAEAVMDLISSKTERAQAAAVCAVEGHLYQKISKIRNTLLDLLALIEAHIDFPEDDIPTEQLHTISSSLADVRGKIDTILKTANEGKVLRNGISIAIVGRPNVGKSSLMNQLLGYDRAITSHIPGTTRDTIEETANIRGLPITFIDTAGIRSSSHSVESSGITRSHKAINTCDIVIYVLDTSKRFTKIDQQLLSACTAKPHLIVLNKIDLQSRFSQQKTIFHSTPIRISALTGEGIESLKNAIENQVFKDQHSSIHNEYTVNDRQASSLRNSLAYIDEIISIGIKNLSIEILSQGIRSSLNSIGEVVGSTTTEDLLERIFSNFCIGK